MGKDITSMKIKWLGIPPTKNRSSISLQRWSWNWVTIMEQSRERRALERERESRVWSANLFFFRWSFGFVYFYERRLECRRVAKLSSVYGLRGRPCVTKQLTRGLLTESDWRFFLLTHFTRRSVFFLIIFLAVSPKYLRNCLFPFVNLRIL